MHLNNKIRPSTALISRLVALQNVIRKSPRLPKGAATIRPSYILQTAMRIRFYNDDKTAYVTIRPEEYKLYVKKPRKARKVMPLPKASNPTLASSFATLEALDAVEAKLKFMALIEDFETTLKNSGKDAMISLKLGYKSGYQLSLKPNKTSMWFNVSAPTVIECVEKYLKGEFDNA